MSKKKKNVEAATPYQVLYGTPYSMATYAPADDSRVMIQKNDQISAWGYFCYNVVWFIPIIGWLMCLFTALFSKNRYKKNFAVSRFCFLLMFAVIAVVAAGALLICDALGVFELSSLIENVTGLFG